MLQKFKSNTMYEHKQIEKYIFMSLNNALKYETHEHPTLPIGNQSESLIYFTIREGVKWL